uniref:HAT C-terminal dimerisation domain-containing protein n=1 Tax=Esox lucius TaxID=8010 RepID=A0AAY5JX14_ESOLU
MECGREQDHSAFNAWKYRHYFEFDSVKGDKNISIRCTLCVGRTFLSTAKNSTSNLSKHLASCHRNVKLGPSPAKQVKIDLKTMGLLIELNKLVAGYIVENMLPISTVDSESFRRIIEKIPTKHSVKLLQRNFMGVTVHWINSTLQRNKAAVACKRIRGRHTYDVIGAEIEEIHSLYGLHGKVVATVTDNASNFAKAFRVCDDDDEEPTFTDVIEALSTPLNRWRKLMVPTSTRWNSLYEAISRIITIPMNELNPLCVKLGIKCLNEREYIFLQEYCTVMKPMTVALDILQGDECTYGALLPTLTCLMSKTLALKDDLSRMTASLPDRRREHLKELLTTECRKAAPAADNANVSQLAASTTETDIFDFENQPTESFSAENAVTDYLRSGYELEILNQFPNLKKMYIKYNTPTPSSAPVERLFSLGELVLPPKRNRLCDKRFEKLLLMRYNHSRT